MNIFSAIKPAWEVLQAGKELKHAAAWKNIQLVALVITSLASLATAVGVDLGLTQEQILGTAGTIAAIAAYFVPATSARVGFGGSGSIPVEIGEIKGEVGPGEQLEPKTLPPVAKPRSGENRPEGRPGGVLRIGPPAQRVPTPKRNDPPVRDTKGGSDSDTSGRGSYDDWADGH